MTISKTTAVTALGRERPAKRLMQQFGDGEGIGALDQALADIDAHMATMRSS